MDPVNVTYQPNLKSVALPFSEIIAIDVLGTPKLGEEEGVWGRRWYRSKERALVSSYRPSIVTVPLSLRVSEILPLLCYSTPLFPTPPLVSPKFPYVPLGVGGWPLGYRYEEQRCWANCSCN